MFHQRPATVDGQPAEAGAEAAERVEQGPARAPAARPLRRQAKGSKIRSKIGSKWDGLDRSKGHQPTASRCESCV